MQDIDEIAWHLSVCLLYGGCDATRHKWHKHGTSFQHFTRWRKLRDWIWCLTATAMVPTMSRAEDGFPGFRSQSHHQALVLVLEV